MPWARFEDDYLGNQKLATLSTAAICLDMASIVYSARELRDGVLSVADVQAIATLIHLRRWQPVAVELVAVKRWSESAAGGYAIHDYLEYQPSRQQVLEERAAKHEAKVRAGQLGGLAKASKRGSKTEANGVANAKQNPSPVPGPGPGPVPLRYAEHSVVDPPTPPASGGAAPPDRAPDVSTNGTAVEMAPRIRTKRPEPPAEPACCPDFARTGSEHWAYCPNAKAAEAET